MGGGTNVKNEEKVNSTEADIFLNEPGEKGFDILFDIIPAISLYQIMIGIFSLWVQIPGAAIQVAGVILQAEPGENFKCSI